MAEKKTLLVYYSRTGTTAKAGQAIAAALGCEVEEIVDTKDRRGVKGWFGAAKDACGKKGAQIAEPRNDPAVYDLVVIGTPVWAFSMTPAVRAYLQRFRDSLPDVAFFLTTGGSGIDNTFGQMEEACGKPPTATLGLKAKEVKKDAYADKVKGFAESLGV